MKTNYSSTEDPVERTERSIERTVLLCRYAIANGFVKNDETLVDADMYKVFYRKVNSLFAEDRKFKRLLLDLTSFLPKSASLKPIQRLYYALSGESKPHTCTVCDSFIQEFKDRYCCHECSTLAPVSGAKRGPKVDLAAHESVLRNELKSRKGYSLVTYGRHTSTFKHHCGNEFTVGNRPIVEGSGSCPCEHKKLVLHDKASLQAWHDEHHTGYKVVRYDHTVVGNKEATLKCANGHKFVERKFYSSQCLKCTPDRLATQRWDPVEYAKFIKTRQPRFKLLDAYVDSITPVRFKHLICGHIFSTTTPKIARHQFRCPACSPKTCGSYRTVLKDGREIKLRGKEHIALDWMLKRGKFDLKDIEFDSEGTIPYIGYVNEVGKNVYYRPDMYVKSSNLLIEVKDPRTLGLEHVFFYKTAAELWAVNCLKAQACIERNYKFRMMLFDKNNARISLPKKWYLLSHKKIKLWYSEQPGTSYNGDYSLPEVPTKKTAHRRISMSVAAVHASRTTAESEAIAERISETLRNKSPEDRQRLSAGNVMRGLLKRSGLAMNHPVVRPQLDLLIGRTEWDGRALTLDRFFARCERLVYRTLNQY